MKVVHLSTTDMGGAYEAAQRISDALLSAGWESEVLVRSKYRTETDAVPFYDTLLRKFFSKVKNFFNLLLSDGDVVIDKYGADICSDKRVQEADILCLHWVNSFVSVPEVERILKLGKPVYWIMHDMWPFTGGCHYAWDCGAYTESCRKCPKVNAVRGRSVCYWQNKKQECFRAGNLLPVGPSKWIADCARQSRIFGDKRIATIPNPIDTELFYPRSDAERQGIRKQLGLSENKHTILFGAAKVTDNPIKGFSYFADAVKELKEEEYQILVLGESTGDDALKAAIGLPVVYTGFIRDSERLCEIYNAADLLAAPSLQENYSNTVLEALSCGVPAVVFDVGGMGDLVQTGCNGYLAKLKDAEDLRRGIVSVSRGRAELSPNARKRVLEINSLSVIGARYGDLFMEHKAKEDKDA